MSARWEILEGDCLAAMTVMPAQSVHCCITSPPYYGLRDYGSDGQIGLEPTPDAYVTKLVEVFHEVKRVLQNDGALWLNLGDSYAGSWGAQSRPDPGEQGASTLDGGSMLSARQIEAHPRITQTGSLKNTPGCKPKDLLGIPWMVAFALRADGWYLRSEIIWAKPNPMPESVTDRPTKAHEQVFLLSKNARYYYDAEAIKESAKAETYHDATGTARVGIPGRTDDSPVGKRDKQRMTGEQRIKGGDRWGGFNDSGRGHDFKRNKRSVWTVATQPYPEAHFATFPPKLIEPMVLAGCPAGGTVLDPFCGSGTTLQVAIERGRNALGIELNADYCALAQKRLYGLTAPLFA